MTFAFLRQRKFQITAAIIALAAVLVSLAVAVIAGHSSGGGTSQTIFPIALLLGVLTLGAIGALVGNFVVNKRNIAPKAVFGTIGGLLAIIFFFVLIAYIFPGFGRAMGFSTPAPANAAAMVDPNAPPPPPAKKIERTKWVEKEILSIPHLDPTISVADFVPTATGRNFKWHGTGSWCGGTLAANSGCSGLWHGLTGQERSGQLDPIRGKPYPVSAGIFPVDNLVITAEEPEIEVVDNPEYFAHCAKYNNCLVDQPAS